MRPAERRARAVVDRLPDGPVSGAEIGVFRGEMSAALLNLRPDLSLYMVDSWLGAGEQPEAYIDSGDYHARLPIAHQRGFMAQADRVTRFAQTRRTILRMDSLQAAAEIADGSLDFVFIDADHSYEGCTADIEAWRPKAMPGGLLGGHDYHNDTLEREVFGVDRAVDEAAGRFGWTIETGDHYTWFVRP